MTGAYGGAQIREDVFGNVNYGFMMEKFGVREDLAVRASHANGIAGNPDPADDASIKAGYQMARKYPGGPTSSQYLSFILKHGPADTVVNPK